MFRRRFALLALLMLTACTEPTVVDCGAGQYYSDDTGRYCAYGVIVGGFTCPVELPFAFDVELPEGLGLTCSDRSSGGPLPLPVCADLGAPDGCEGTLRSTPSADGGPGRAPLPERTANCAPFFGPPTPGSIGGIRVGEPGTDPRMPLDELSDGDTATVYQDPDGHPALAIGLQIGADTGASVFTCYKIRIRTTIGDTVIESPPAGSADLDSQYVTEWEGRLPVVHDYLGSLEGSLDGQAITLEIAAQEGAVEETRTIALELADP